MVNDLITDIIRWGVGLACLVVIVFVLFIVSGIKIEFMGTFRCRSRAPGTHVRCALRSGGHLGVKHRDRSGRRTWW